MVPSLIPFGEGESKDELIGLSSEPLDATENEQTAEGNLDADGGRAGGSRSLHSVSLSV